MNKELLEKAFNAGAVYATGSHKDFEQIHPYFNQWYEKLQKDLKNKEFMAENKDKFNNFG